MKAITTMMERVTATLIIKTHKTMTKSREVAKTSTKRREHLKNNSKSFIRRLLSPSISSQTRLLIWSPQRQRPYSSIYHLWLTKANTTPTLRWAPLTSPSTVNTNSIISITCKWRDITLSRGESTSILKERIAGLIRLKIKRERLQNPESKS